MIANPVGNNPANTVLITGAAGGLGKAFASECASRGWDLALVDLNGAALLPLANGLRRMFGIAVETFPCDLTDVDERQELWRRLYNRFDRLRGLINVAGVEYEGLFRERTHEELRTILRLNIEAVVENTHRALRLLPGGTGAFIINVSSLAAVNPMPVKAVYAASKRFLLNYSIALHHELKEEGIHVLALAPAGLPTHRASLQRIKSQGLWGQLTTHQVGTVAHGALDRVLRGRSHYIPGLINRIIYALSTLLPQDTTAAFIHRRFMKALHARRRQGLDDQLPLVQPPGITESQHQHDRKEGWD